MAKMIEINLAGEVIDSGDYQAKYEEIKGKLDVELFNALDDFAIYDTKVDSAGNITKKKKVIKKNEIMPTLSVMQVNAKLNEYLRVYKPYNKAEAMLKDDTEYMEALRWYMALISYINKFVSLIPSKQSFSAFANISTATYNEMLADPKFSDVFSSIEDYLIDFNYTAGASSLFDTKMVQSRLQTKDAGHNLVKPVENLTIIQNNTIDRQAISEKLKQFEIAMKPKN